MAPTQLRLGNGARLTQSISNRAKVDTAQVVSVSGPGITGISTHPVCWPPRLLTQQRCERRRPRAGDGWRSPFT